MNKIPDLFFNFFPALRVPDNFWTGENEKKKCLYIATCTEDAFLYATDEFGAILGYSSELLYKGGLQWWFSLIHPEDLQPMLNSIFHHCFLTPVRNRLNKPFTLAYRILHAGNRWIWLQETKCIVAVTDEGNNKIIVGRFEEMNAGIKLDENEMSRLLHENRDNNTMVKAALPILKGKMNENKDMLNFHKPSGPPSGTMMPTKREREILHLIGEGLSTKQIAGQLHISVNTVETHRRHLLEKVKVKNSMELIKQTSHFFWAKSI